MESSKGNGLKRSSILVFPILSFIPYINALRRDQVMETGLFMSHVAPGQWGLTVNNIWRMFVHSNSQFYKIRIICGWCASLLVWKFLYHKYYSKLMWQRFRPTLMYSVSNNQLGSSSTLIPHHNISFKINFETGQCSSWLFKQEEIKSTSFQYHHHGNSQI